MSAEPLPEWFYPPSGGWTADDLDRLPRPLRVETEMTIKLGRRQRPEPDIVVLDSVPFPMDIDLTRLYDHPAG